MPCLCGLGQLDSRLLHPAVVSCGGTLSALTCTQLSIKDLIVNNRLQLKADEEVHASISQALFSYDHKLVIP